jgi:hypothetical protein
MHSNPRLPALRWVTRFDFALWGPMSGSGHFRKSALMTARSPLPPRTDILSLATHVGRLLGIKPNPKTITLKGTDVENLISAFYHHARELEQFTWPEK